MSARSDIRIDLRDFPLCLGGESALGSFTASFAPGELSALVGGDGAGKTTLLSTLARPQGRALLGITDLDAHDIGYQPASSGVWPNMSVEENLRFVADAHGLRGPRSRARIDELIDLAGLESARRRIGARLSGGMRQKLGAAMALLHRPSLLLLDEPTTGVDPASREILGRLIRGAADDGATAIVATTYLDEAESADRVFLLDEGRILAQGSPAEVIAIAPGSLWSAPIDSASPSATDDERVWQRGRTLFEWLPGRPRPSSASLSSAPSIAGAGKDASPVAPLTIGGASPATPDLELATVEFLLEARTLTPPSRDGDHLTPSSNRGPALVHRTRRSGSDAIIACREVIKSFGKMRALDSVDLDVHPGEVVGLIGGNGAGKSTLIRLILGIDAPDSGTISLFGTPPSRRSRARIGYVSQALGLYPMLSARENLDFTQDVFGVPAADRLQGAAERGPVAELPLGAQRTLAVDCALSHSPDLLVLDEPTSGMDSLGRARLWKKIRRASNTGAGILVTTHYQQEAAQCDILIRLETGRVVEIQRTQGTSSP
ncbi:MAG: ATP-binding cassette domain-containing protein [Schaalia hyovaginalis]|uniref:ATP-binding cassette domain-containing protein n=2 Tax=Schaalia hyovaginalis TaxID=29316 RepID=UPI002A7ECCBA|nr:ATP-binding cassette domain-containing protein [Schaalia hyovaginalis]MDY4263561.1 ATP-binding cassette domain-containing protein [Schaalia hyovaginalis]